MCKHSHLIFLHGTSHPHLSPYHPTAARVEAMRAARRAAEAEADDEATDDEAEAAAEEDELLLGCI